MYFKICRIMMIFKYICVCVCLKATIFKLNSNKDTIFKENFI